MDTQEGQENPQQLVTRPRVQVEESEHTVNPANRAYEVVLSGEDLGGEGEKGNVFKKDRTYKNVKKEALEQKDAFGNKYLV